MVPTVFLIFRSFYSPFFNVIYEILNELALVFFDAVLFMQNVHFIYLRRAQSGQLFWLPISLESVMLHSIHACLIVPFFSTFDSNSKHI